MHRPKVLVSGYLGFNNFGDENIFKVLCENLKAQNAQITAITANPKLTKFIYGVDTIKNFNFFKIINAICETDILISGGGSLLQDKTSLKSLLYYLSIICAAKMLGKKVIIFAQGIGPLNSKTAKFAVKYTLKSCDEISVRDEKSLFLLRGWGINADLQPDPVFNLELPAYSPQGKIGVQLRSWKCLTEAFMDELAKNIVNNFGDREILIFSFQDCLDLEICNYFELKLKSISPEIKTRVIRNNEQNNLVNNMKTLDYLIAMRFHACLTALKFGIKTLAINYDDKVEKLAQEAHIPFVNLDKQNELEMKFNELKALKSSYLFAYANGKKFDFTKINELISEVSKT